MREIDRFIRTASPHFCIRAWLAGHPRLLDGNGFNNSRLRFSLFDFRIIVVLDTPDHCIGKLEDVIHRCNLRPQLFFIFIKNGNLLFRPIEIETANRFSIVVVKQNGEIRHRIPVYNPINVNPATQSGFDDIESL